LPDVGSGRRGSGGGVARARRDAERKRTNGAASPYTLARFPSRLLTFWEGVKGVMPARLSRQTDTRADSHALAIWLTSQTYCFVIMHVSVLFGGLFLASPLPLSPEYIYAPPRTPVQARIPAYVLLEHLFKRALAHASACASLHIEVLPAAGAASSRVPPVLHERATPPLCLLGVDTVSIRCRRVVT
jgi:hypothetical protein